MNMVEIVPVDCRGLESRAWIGESGLLCVIFPGSGLFCSVLGLMAGTRLQVSSPS